MQAKTVLVTGGTRGIGKVIVETLLNEGYIVYTCSRNEQELEQLKQSLDSQNLHILSLDLSNRVAIQQFTTSWNIPLYGIVHNAGICRTQTLEQGTDNWDTVVKTNLEGPYFLTQGLLSHIQDRGRIVTISSQLGIEGRAGYSAYCASKFGLIGLTKTWAYELGSRGITVNAICPGWVNTQMAQQDLVRMASEKGMSKDELYAQICSQLELKRFQEPHEIADFTCYLLSAKASAITGQAIKLAVVWNQTEN